MTYVTIPISLGKKRRGKKRNKEKGEETGEEKR